MNKKELTREVALKAEMTQKDATVAVDAVFEAVTEALAKKDEVSVPGFGKFEYVAKPAKKCRNPKTGESMMSEAHGSLRFKAAKALKDAVR